MGGSGEGRELVGCLMVFTVLFDRRQLEPKFRTGSRASGA